LLYLSLLVFKSYVLFWCVEASYSAYLISLAVPIAIVAAQQGNNNGTDGGFFNTLALSGLYHF